MEQSILKTVKKMIGLDENYNVFDLDLLVYINGIFADLHQIGLGPVAGFEIEDDTATWTSYTQDDTLLNNAKTFIVMRCRQQFDSPQTGPLAEALDAMIKKQEWRLYVYADEKKEASAL